MSKADVTRIMRRAARSRDRRGTLRTREERLRLAAAETQSLEAKIEALGTFAEPLDTETTWRLCAHCNTRFYSERKAAKFCSVRCNGQAKVKPPVACRQCGMLFKRHKSGIHPKRYCSNRCASRAMAQGKVKRGHVEICSVCNAEFHAYHSMQGTCPECHAVDARRRDAARKREARWYQRVSSGDRR